LTNVEERIAPPPGPAIPNLWADTNFEKKPSGAFSEKNFGEQNAPVPIKWRLSIEFWAESPLGEEA
jgi:hypothetical protein